VRAIEFNFLPPAVPPINRGEMESTHKAPLQKARHDARTNIEWFCLSCWEKKTWDTSFFSSFVLSPTRPGCLILPAETDVSPTIDIGRRSPKAPWCFQCSMLDWCFRSMYFGDSGHQTHTVQDCAELGSNVFAGPSLRRSFSFHDQHLIMLTNLYEVLNGFALGGERWQY